MERECKNLKFGRHLNQALDLDSNTDNGQLCRIRYQIDIDIMYMRFEYFDTTMVLSIKYPDSNIDV
jgi:hypothetical protein